MNRIGTRFCLVSPCWHMEPVLENAAYRIIQEAVANARQHSGSDKIVSEF